MSNRPKRVVLEDAAPWKPAKYEEADVSALQALLRGEANVDQQKRALKWIIEKASGTYQPSYRPGPDGERDTAFAEGRRAVGLNIVTLLHLNLSILRRNEK